MTSCDFQKCSNCGACINICPVDAISVQKDNLFYSLLLDENKCLCCGQCESVCPVNNSVSVQSLISGYGAFVDDNSILYTSSSGGLFQLIANMTLKNGGVVFGAAFSDDRHSVVFKSTDEVSLLSLQKSKYVESDVGYSFRKIRDELRTGRDVLFCGTPCQVHGLKRFLRKEYDNLTTIDFSCGGLPSHKIYDEHLKYLEKRYKSIIKDVDFRPKNYGWNRHSILTKFTNGKVYTRIAELDPYFRSFLRQLNRRDYCYECKFADKHCSDIILADLWLYKKISSLDNQNRGLSLVLTNSTKGEQIFNQIKDQLVFESIPLEKASYNIQPRVTSDQLLSRHDLFKQYYEQFGLKVSLNKILPISFLKLMKLWTRQLLGRRRHD